MVGDDLKAVGHLGAYKDEMIRLCLKNLISAENFAGSGSDIHDLKTVVHMKGHMKFGESKGIKCCDLSQELFFLRHNDVPPRAGSGSLKS